MPIVCLGLNHRTAPVNVREQFALAEAKISKDFIEPAADGILAPFTIHCGGRAAQVTVDGATLDFDRDDTWHIDGCFPIL